MGAAFHAQLRLEKVTTHDADILLRSGSIISSYTCHLSGLAGLTYWLRLQVVTYISGRRSFEQNQPLQLIKDFVNNKEVHWYIDNQNLHSNLSFTYLAFAD